MTISIKKIAAFAGTSTAAVSLVLNDKWHKKVRPEIAQKVIQVARRKGYVGSATARGLVMQKHFRVTVFLPEFLLGHPLLGWSSTYELLSIISAGLNAGGYALEMLGMDTALGVFRNSRSIAQNRDAVIFLSPAPGAAKKLLAGTKIPVPYIVVDADLHDRQLSYICTDMTRSTGKAISYFLDRRCSGIAVVRGEASTTRFHAKMWGYKKALSQAGIEFDSSLIFQRQNLGAFERGYMAGAYFAAMKKRPSVIFCTDNTCAVGVLSFLRENKIKVPEEIEIMGFGDRAMAKFAMPAISCIERPIQEMGRICVEKILTWLEKKQPFEPCQIRCEEKIVFQGTTKSLQDN